MRKPVTAALAAASLLAFAPAASAAPDLPPLDPVKVDGGFSECPPDYPCTPVWEDPSVTYDKTYPSRLVTWAVGDLVP